MNTREIFLALRNKGGDNVKGMLDALEDGELLKAIGVTDADTKAVDTLYIALECLPPETFFTDEVEA